MWPGINIVPGQTADIYKTIKNIPMKPILPADTDLDEADDLLRRFQKQLTKVEQLMNASMRPLMRQDLLLSEEASRQALETLERWSELYRHGLEASGMISERGEKWLHEAYQRLSLTVDELRKLDTTNEAMVTEKKAEKAKHFLDAVEKIAHFILPLADEIKTPLTNKIPEAAI